MDSANLRELQAPLKERYRSDPASARTAISAHGDYRDDAITCTVQGWAGPVRAGLHPATGGDGSDACSGDMLLEALLACAGVTLRSVATAMTKIRRVAQLSTRVHYVSDWSTVTFARAGVQAAAPALLVAASSFRSPRPACGILAAGVQQRIVSADELSSELARATRLRHHASLVLAVRDIAQGSEALSEIDLVRLCRRHGLPEPARQVVRAEPSGRRRYVDAEWIRSDGRRVVVEVDGALHLIVTNWHSDQLRQNEITIGGAIVLRYPSVVVRDEELLVVDQLRRALLV